MALSRYVLTADVTVPAGGFTAVTLGTGSWAQGAGLYGAAGGAYWRKNQVILADPAGALFLAIGAGNLRAYVPGTDDAGHAALSN